MIPRLAGRESPRELLWHLARLETDEQAAAYALRYLRGDSAAPIVAREARNVRSCLNIYGAIRAVSDYTVSVAELRRTMRHEQLRWYRDYNDRSFRADADDEEYVLELSGLLLRVIGSKVGKPLVGLGRTTTDPLGFTWLVRGEDWLADVYLELFRLMMERREIDACEGCGVLFPKLGKRRFHDDACGARARQRRKRALPTLVPTSTR